MSGGITLTISLFGAFRPYGNGDTLTLEVQRGANAAAIKNRLKEVLKQSCPEFDKAALVDESALADDTQVLAEDATVQESARLAILPPVCGG